MYHKTKLANGLRLITVPLKETKSVNLLALVKTGSRYETSKNNGISHFIEHLMFKGTKKRPTTLALAKELDGVGAEFNAFTSKDYTGYYIKSDARHLDLAIDVLSDMLLHSKFAGQEIEREKRVIIEEINMYEDNPIMYVEDLLEELLFAGNPLGRLITGQRESVSGLERQDLLGYRARHYFGKNAVIGLAGNFSQRHLTQIKNKFKFKPGPKPESFIGAKIKQTKPQAALLFKNTEQAQIALGFPACSLFSEKIYPLTILAVILGGNMSSRLFLRVRERRGLAYFIRADLNLYEDTGCLNIQAGLDKKRIYQAIKLILAELKKMTAGVTGGELNRAKEYLAGQLILNLEDTANLAQWYAKQELLTGKILTPEEKIKKIMAVSRSEVAAVAQAIIDFNKLNLAVIGPFKDKQLFLDLIK